ncbi:NTP transferase domain-containing protein [Halosolutus amylolyticus]|uniref:NTP transferase domain-containing protein n=1 Tax=Halosolutus amylolyticus TaxID=2932267 RepID=A0ABD5PLG6_9EURY|nr:nucleotidyltransferase family protein [Halosolutus amylolyticus]
MTRETLPVVDPPPVAETDPDAAVQGIVLAAGTSSRYGPANKLLDPLDGDPLVRHAVATLVDSRLDAVAVVLGHDADRVRAALEAYDDEVRFLRNEDYECGQSTSVRAGVARARETGADAVLFALGDMPSVSPATIDTLVAAYDRGYGSVLAAGYDGSRGNPVLFGSRHFDALASVSGDVGGRDVLRRASDAAVVETGDPGVLRDVDRPADLERVTRDSDPS